MQLPNTWRGTAHHQPKGLFTPVVCVYKGHHLGHPPTCSLPSPIAPLNTSYPCQAFTFLHLLLPLSYPYQVVLFIHSQSSTSFHHWLSFTCPLQASTVLHFHLFTHYIPAILCLFFLSHPLTSTLSHPVRVSSLNPY